MPDTKQDNKVKRSAREWLLLTCGAVMLISGAGLLWLWSMNTRDPLSATAGMGLIAGGGYLIYTNLFTQGTGVKVNITGDIVLTGRENCINYYVTKNEDGSYSPDKLVFEEKPKDELKKIGGQPHQLINNGKYYFLNRVVYNKNDSVLKSWELKDSPGISPEALAKYIELPGQRAYLKHRDSVLKMIGPALLTILNIVGLIVIIALAG